MKASAVLGTPRGVATEGLVPMRHYPNTPQHPHMVNRIERRSCTIEGCGDLAVGRGLCRRHYDRWRRYGDPCAVGRVKKPKSIPPTKEERFWTKVDKSGECWIWTGYVTRTGYGRCNRAFGNGYAHRAAWEFAHGAVPDGLFVCHHCDNPPCCNPEHLFIGTQTDNISDRDRKGRTARGERSGYYTHPEAFEAFRENRAQMFGDDNPMRKHPERIARGERNGHARLTEADVIRIRELHIRDGMTYPQIAEMFGMSRHHVAKIVRGERWTFLSIVARNLAADEEGEE